LLLKDKKMHKEKLQRINTVLLESTKSPKRVIKKRLKNVDKAIVEIAQMKFKNFEEKEEKLDALVFLKNQILREAEELQIK